MDADHRISVYDLLAGYGDHVVIDGLTFCADEGSVLTIAGPNGAGKSTLLRTRAGLRLPSGGQVKIDGTDIRKLSGKERARKIAVLFTERTQREPETCFETVCQGRYPYTGLLGSLSDKDREIVREAMRATDCLDLEDRSFGQLSDGQKQRILLARAIAQQPEILLLDEPATYLDLRYQLELMSLLRSLASDEKRRLTVIMSLHDIRLAERFSDTLLMLKDGKLFAEGRPEEIVSPGRLAALFQIDRRLMEDFWGKGKEKTQAEGRRPDAPDLDSVNASAPRGMKKGFTTGTAAALAAQGASALLLCGICPDRLSVMTPAGIRVSVRHDGCRLLSDDEAECTVRKYAGDDIDATDGIRITAKVRLTKEPGIHIDGGEGIGRVTKPGLDQPVGAAAINHVPRKMIGDVLSDIAAQSRYEGGFSVVIKAEEGERRAQNTMNGMLGITGGISVLGTGGIVEPMSRQALIDTIRVDIRQQAAMGYDRLILVPGKYGMDFVKSSGLASAGIPVVLMSNFVGEALDIAGEEGISKVLLTGHVGKLVKLEASIMNTHSACADGRREIFVACAAMAGAPRQCLQRLWDCATSDAAIDVLHEYSLLEETAGWILGQIQTNLDKRTGGRFEAGAVLFCGKGRLFGITEKGRKLLGEFGGTPWFTS